MIKRFKEVLEIKNGKNQKSVENPDGLYAIYGSGGVMGHADDYICDANTVIIGRKGSINNPIFVEEPFWNVDTAFGLVANEEILLPRYLFYFCKKYDFEKLNTTVTIPSLTKANLLNIEIDIPCMAEQENIVKEFQKLESIFVRKNQQLRELDTLIKARFVEMFGDPVSNIKGWERVALGERCDIVTGNTPSRADLKNYGKFIEWIKSDNINTPSTFLTKAQEYLSETGFQKCRFVDANSLLMTCIAGSINCIGNVALTNRRVAFNQQINAIIPNQDNVFYLYWLMTLSKPMIRNTVNMALKGILSKGQLSGMLFPFPPVELQNQFATFVTQADKSKVAIQKSLDETQLLFDALMQKYFG